MARWRSWSDTFNALMSSFIDSHSPGLLVFSHSSARRTSGWYNASLSVFAFSALRENLTARPSFMPPSPPAAPQETDVGHRHPLGTAGEWPFRLNYSADYGQRLDESVGVPRLSGL